MKRSIPLLLIAALLLIAGCRTVGVSREKGGYAIVAPPVANEMLLDHRQVLVIDVRNGEDFDGPTGHIAGAMSAPVDSMELYLAELLPFVNSTILVYGADEEQGARGARILVAAGFKNIILISGGLAEWERRGYQTVRSVP